MLNLVRRIRRRSALIAAVAATLLTAVTAVVTATPAAAIGGGFNPLTAPPVIPGTSTVVSEWKLAGEGFAQGVQVAPQWIIASGHAHPVVGSTFTNEYGSAVVDKLAGDCGSVGSGCDISVAHLATPIAAPAFPPLLLDGVPDQPGTTVAGNTLAVGNGGSTNGLPTVAWTAPDPSSLTLSELQSGVGGIPGDSGGPAFYYYPGATAGVLQGLNSAASYGVTDGLQEFNSAQVKPFLDSVLPAGTINWTTFSQLGPLPLVPQPVADPTVTANREVIRVTWPAVNADPPVTGYRVVLVPTGNVLAPTVISTDANTHVAVFLVPTGVPYGVFVLASNANGESKAPYASLGGSSIPPTVTWPTTAAASIAPAAPTGLTVTQPGTGLLSLSFTPGDTPIDGVTKYEATVLKCTASPCTAAPLTPVADHTFTSASGDVVYLPSGTTAGTQLVVEVREHNTAGTSVGDSQFVTYTPQDTPLPPTSLTVTPQADGSTAVTFTVPPTDPEPGYVAGYTPHAPPTLYAIEANVPGQGAEILDFEVPGQSSYSFTFNIATDFGYTPGSYSVFAQSFGNWGNSPPLSLTAPLGILPASAPVTAVGTAAPPAPASLNVPPVGAVGDTNTVTWTQPPSGPGTAPVDEYLIDMQDVNGNPAAPPILAVVPANQASYTFQVPFTSQYTVNVYAFSQQAGASAPATQTGVDQNLG